MWRHWEKAATYKPRNRLWENPANILTSEFQPSKYFYCFSHPIYGIRCGNLSCLIHSSSGIFTSDLQQLTQILSSQILGRRVWWIYSLSKTRTYRCRVRPVRSQLIYLWARSEKGEVMRLWPLRLSFVQGPCPLKDLSRWEPLMIDTAI
jgi:hypothetical protein